MDAIRGVIGVGLAQLMVLSAMAPVYADIDEREDDHRRAHGHRHSLAVSHNREDYPVILNWLTSPDSADGTQGIAVRDQR